MLSASGPRHGRHCDRHFPFDCAHEESGRCHQRFRRTERRNRAFPQLIPEQGPDNRSAQRPSFRRHQAPVRRSRIAYQGGEHSDAQGDKDFVLRHRRGALHLRMGPRLQAGIQKDTQHHRRDRTRTYNSLDGHRHSEGPERHPEESRNA